MPKRGFPTPYARWFRGRHLSAFIDDLLLSGRSRSRGVFNAVQIERWVRGNRRSKFDTLSDYALANRIYSAALLEQWFRIFVDGERPAKHRNLPRTGAFAARLASHRPMTPA